MPMPQSASSQQNDALDPVIGSQSAKSNDSLILYGIIIGILVGGLAGYTIPEFSVRYLGIFGDLFLNLLKMLIVPMVVTSMICGVASLGDVRKIGRTGTVTLIFFLATTFLAVLLGIALVLLVQPGVGYPLDQEAARAASAAKLAARGDYQMIDALRDIVLGFTSDNIFKSAVEMKVLPLIVFALVLGGILTTFAGGKRILEDIDVLNEAILRFVRLVMLLAPLGVLGLVASKLGQAQLEGKFFQALASLFYYAMTVIGGLMIHGFIFLPIILWMFAKRNPFQFTRQLAKPLATAFATASSNATLPLTIETLETQAGLSKRIVGFVAPLGATINMNGTALYEAVATIFIAQAYGIHLGPAEVAITSITATLAAIGAAGIPEAGLVTMILVLKAVGLPTEGIGIILVIDWFLDRCRTTINVWGDCVGAAVVEKWVPAEEEVKE